MGRRTVVILGVVLLALVALAFGGYALFFRAPPLAESPTFIDRGDRLPTPAEFEQLAKTDPVKMLDACLTRYKREVTSGMHCTLEKQERPQGKPAPPELPPVEVIDLSVRGDTADPKLKSTEVLMKWRSGARKPLSFGPELKASLYSERPPLNGKALAWVPGSALGDVGSPTPPNNSLAKGLSRYCVCDAGLYRGLLRTHIAWQRIKDAGELKTEYLGKQTVAKAGGRECYVIKRLCPRLEIDSFEMNGEPNKNLQEGFNEVTLYIDVERWLQVGSELYRVEPDGTRVLIGAYFFRDIDLKPTFAPDTFTVEGLTK